MELVTCGCKSVKQPLRHPSEKSLAVNRMEQAFVPAVADISFAAFEALRYTKRALAHRHQVHHALDRMVNLVMGTDLVVVAVGHLLQGKIAGVHVRYAPLAHHDLVE